MIRLSNFKRKGLCFILAVPMLAMLAACSKDKPAQPSVSHPVGWNDTLSVDFHGKKVLALGSADYCAGCHATDFTGGKSGSSCRACHRPYPHPSGWADMNNPLNHGIRFGSGEFDSTHFKQCMVCHGDSLAGGRVPKKCNDCHSSAAVVVWVSKP